MATAAMSSNGTAGEKSGPGAVNFGAERKRAAETVLEEVTALKGLRKVAKRHGNYRSSNPGLKLPPSAYASVAKANRCSTADIDELCCGRKDLYDVIRGKSEEAGGRDGPCHPVDDKGHIIFEPEKNLTPRFKMLTCVGTGTFGKARGRYSLCLDLRDRFACSHPHFAMHIPHRVYLTRVRPVRFVCCR